jgi:apolipoprotein N-acyltransferase
MKSETPIGLKLLAIFFAFGACMCTLTIGLLSFPGGALDSLWRLNPEAHAVFQRFGGLSILLMVIVGVACALATIGLARNAKWGRWLGILILATNLVGDLTNAFVQHDLRTLIGVPIAGAMIFYLARFESQITKKGRG